jgi:hypothetical protein
MKKTGQGVPFQMKYQGKGGAPALMKALVGNQHKLPENLKQAILDAPSKKVDNKKFGEAKVDVDGKTKTTTKDIGKGRTLTTKKRTVKKIVAPKGRDEMSSAGKKSADTMAARKGGGRLGTETTQKVSQKGVKGNTKTSTAYSGTAKDATGRTKYRTVNGEKIVVEGTVSAIKPRSVDTGKKKSKGKSPAKSYGKSPVKSTGGKKDKNKKETRGQKVYREAMARVTAQKEAAKKKKKTGGVRVKMGMGTSLKTYRMGGKK